MGEFGIPLTGNGEGHHTTFQHFHGIHAEDRFTVAIQNGTGARWLQDFAAFRVVTESHREGFSTLVNAVDVGLHGKSLGHLAGGKGQGAAGGVKIVGFGGVIGLNTGGKIHCLLKISVAGAGNGKHHQPALQHFSGIHAEARGVIVRVVARSGTVVQNRHSTRVATLCDDSVKGRFRSWITQTNTESLSTLKHIILGGLDFNGGFGLTLGKHYSGGAQSGEIVVLGSIGCSVNRQGGNVDTGCNVSVSSSGNGQDNDVALGDFAAGNGKLCRVFNQLQIRVIGGIRRLCIRRRGGIGVTGGSRGIQTDPAQPDKGAALVTGAPGSGLFQYFVEVGAALQRCDHLIQGLVIQGRVRGRVSIGDTHLTIQQQLPPTRQYNRRCVRDGYFNDGALARNQDFTLVNIVPQLQFPNGAVGRAGNHGAGYLGDGSYKLCHARILDVAFH